MHVQSVSYRSAKASHEFVASLRETGFAVLAQHPIVPDLIAASFSEWERFFASADKMDYLFRKEDQAEYFPFLSENAKGYRHKDLKEFYHYYDWGKLPPVAATATPRLRQALVNLAAELLEWIESELPEGLRDSLSCPLSEMIRESGQTLLRPIHYPPLTGQEAEGQVRAAAHEDINLITLLPAATEPGLEVMDLLGNWHAVQCDPGTLVINSGDMLKEATQGYFPSTTHQVVNPPGESGRKSRLSMPLFLHPRPEVRLSERHTAKSYLHERLVEIGLK